MSRVKDLTGFKTETLEVIAFAGVKNRNAMYNCRCYCGNEFIARGADVKNGNTKSCGCLSKKWLDKRKSVTDKHSKPIERLICSSLLAKHFNIPLEQINEFIRSQYKHVREENGHLFLTPEQFMSIKNLIIKLVKS